MAGDLEKVRRKTSRKYVDRSLQTGKGVKILMSYVNANQRVTSTEKLNNQVDRMTHSMDNQPFPRSHTCHCLKGP